MIETFSDPLYPSYPPYPSHPPYPPYPPSNDTSYSPS